MGLAYILKRMPNPLITHTHACTCTHVHTYACTYTHVTRAHVHTHSSPRGVYTRHHIITQYIISFLFLKIKIRLNKFKKILKKSLKIHKF